MDRRTHINKGQSGERQRAESTEKEGSAGDRVFCTCFFPNIFVNKPPAYLAFDLRVGARDGVGAHFSCLLMFVCFGGGGGGVSCQIAALLAA